MKLINQNPMVHCVVRRRKQLLKLFLSGNRLQCVALGSGVDWCMTFLV